MTDWDGRKTSYDYDENGRLSKTSRPNGTVETRAYDKAGRLIEILDKKGGTEVNHQEYSYDSSGNITEVKQLSEGELNFTGVTSAEMTYDENNRLLTYNGENIKYDKDGNMIYGPLDGKMTDFVYDCRNRLVQAGDTTYTYDAENNRISVETKEKKIEYTINTQPELSQVLQSTEIKLSEKDEDNRINKDANTTDSENTTTTYYFYGNGLMAQDNGKDYFSYHFNNVGSTMAITDAKGSVVETYNYTPYGELIDGEYREDIPFLYNGQYGVTTDSNGLYYMRARYYNVEIKRFINQDVLLGVLERVSSLNRYAYVEGNPISYLDPFGLDRVDTSDLHYLLLLLSTVGTVIGWVCPPLGYSFSFAVNTVDLWVNCFDLGQNIATGNIKDAGKTLLSIAFDIVGIFTTYNLSAIEYKEADVIVTALKQTIENLNTKASGLSFINSLIQGFDDLKRVFMEAADAM